MQVACGLSQIYKLDSLVKSRNKNFDYLNNKFKEFEDYFILPEKLSILNPHGLAYC